MGPNIFRELNPINRFRFAFLSYILKITNKLHIEFHCEKPRIHVLIPTLKGYYKNILSNSVQRKFLDNDDCYSVDFVNGTNISELFLKVDDIYLGPEFIQT